MFAARADTAHYCIPLPFVVVLLLSEMVNVQNSRDQLHAASRVDSDGGDVGSSRTAIEAEVEAAGRNCNGGVPAAVMTNGEEKKDRDTEREGGLYDLYAVINHFGESGAGHFFTYCRNWKDGNWYSHDDSRITRIDEKDVIRNSAYMLFYHRRGLQDNLDFLPDAVREHAQTPLTEHQRKLLADESERELCDACVSGMCVVRGLA